MAYIFPSIPAYGEEYDMWAWDGEKWTLHEVAVGDLTEFPELFGVEHPDQLFTI